MTNTRISGILMRIYSDPECVRLFNGDPLRDRIDVAGTSRDLAEAADVDNDWLTRRLRIRVGSGIMPVLYLFDRRAQEVIVVYEDATDDQVEAMWIGLLGLTRVAGRLVEA